MSFTLFGVKIGLRDGKTGTKQILKQSSECIATNSVSVENTVSSPRKKLEIC